MLRHTFIKTMVTSVPKFAVVRRLTLTQTDTRTKNNIPFGARIKMSINCCEWSSNSRHTCDHNLTAAHLIDALHSTGIRLRKIDVINEELQALVFFRPIYKALAVEDVGFYEILQLLCVGCPREN